MLTSSRSAMLASVLTLLIVVGVPGYFFYSSFAKSHMQKQATQATSQVTIGDVTLQVEVESTEAAREQGLSGRTSLAEGSGMLFVFEQPSLYGFWMKDMNFDIDMIFADSSGRIVTIARDATAASYKQNPPQVFYPSAPILYVLEVPAGFAESHNIEEGMTLQIN